MKEMWLLKASRAWLIETWLHNAQCLSKKISFEIPQDSKYSLERTFNNHFPPKLQSLSLNDEMYFLRDEQLILAHFGRDLSKKSFD